MLMEEETLSHFKKEVSRVNPEIIANPPLENTVLLFSTPVYREWESGHFLRHVRAVLSQKLDPGQSIEANYNVNLGPNNHHFFSSLEQDNPQPGESRYKNFFEPSKVSGKKDSEFDFMESEKVINFLNDIVEVQRLARKIRELQVAQVSIDQIQEEEKELSKKIASIEDPLVRDLLESAASRCQEVAISGVDSTRVLNKVDTPMEGIELHRTVGLEYASKRLVNPDSIFFLNDADTVPGNNNFVKDVLAVYKSDPKLMYVLVGLSYQPPGTSKDLVGYSMGYVMNHMVTYNERSESVGSPQISCTKEALERIAHISSGVDYEDFTTALRLRSLYSGIQEGILFKTGFINIPTQITSDRPGFVDGSEVRDPLQIEKKIKIGFANAQDLVNEFIKATSRLPDAQRAKLNEEVLETRTRYHNEQEKLLKFNRIVVSAFLTALSTGEIRIHGKDVDIDEQALLGKPFGKALVHYVVGNKELITSLTEDDLKLMRYYVGEEEAFPFENDLLTPFQRSLREYLGKYPPLSDVSISSLKNLYYSRSPQDKTSVLQPFMAEILALGDHIEKYLNPGLFKIHSGYGDEGTDPLKNSNIPALGKRSKWVREAFSQIPPILKESEVGGMQVRLVKEAFPFGELSDFA